MKMTGRQMDQETQEKLTQLFNSQLIAVLGTSSDDDPYTCLVGFRFTSDLRNVIFATMRDRLKYRQISSNPRVSLIIDDRKNSPSDFSHATSATIIGTAIDTEEPERGMFADMLVEKHPFLTDFVKDSNCAIMKVMVEKMYVVGDFERVQKINMA
jgi:nitroimidazol reductase NimA-like FMN-containing flavoprotein (pyridoxamine 5'-phosphate oxidase superfamily)